jgi:outer membrane murein-binding lipoprotein Lpp
MTASRWPVPACAALLLLAGCNTQSRLNELDSRVAALSTDVAALNLSLAAAGAAQQRTAERLARLETELRGFSTTRVLIEPGSEPVRIFGNQSGLSAKITVTNVGASVENLEVQTRRIPKPSDPANPVPGAAGGVELPVDFEQTEWISLKASGARSQVVVPCGAELVGRATGTRATVALLVRFEPGPCLQ